MRIDVLTFEGCPNAQAAVGLVNGLVKELGVVADVHEIAVESPEEAERLRFLGSPSVRVDGRDIEPGAEERAEYVLACRVYRTSTGIAGVPKRDWLEQAIASSAQSSS